MRCILRDQGHGLLQEIHASTCGHHASPRTLVGKAFLLLAHSSRRLQGHCAAL
jgi:hypothetical protein